MVPARTQRPGTFNLFPRPSAGPKGARGPPGRGGCHGIKKVACTELSLVVPSPQSLGVGRQLPTHNQARGNSPLLTARGIHSGPLPTWRGSHPPTHPHHVGVEGAVFLTEDAGEHGDRLLDEVHGRAPLAPGGGGTGRRGSAPSRRWRGD